MESYSTNAQLHARFTPVNDSAYCAENNYAQILGVTGAFCGVAILSLLLRMWVRIRMLKFVGADDCMVIAATLMAIACLVCTIGETRHGTGRHLTCIIPSDLRLQMKWQFYRSIWLMFGVVFVKISIALFLVRLAPKASWKGYLYGAVAFLVCFSLACAGTLIFSCVPVAASWDLKLQAAPSTSCFSSHTYTSIGLFNSVINIVTDFLFALLPVPIIIGLQVNIRTKCSLIFILTIGLVACAAGIVKAHKQATFFADPDRLWDDGFMIWNMIELCLGIIAACLPSLKPLFSSLLSSTRSAIGMSGNPRSKQQTPNAYIGASQASQGYRRQYDPRDFADIMADADMQDSKKGSHATVMSRAESDSMPLEMSRLARSKRAYKVRIASGNFTGTSSSSTQHRDQNSFDNARITRSDSEERLHPGRPFGQQIMRTMEVTRTSEVLPPDDR